MFTNVTDRLLRYVAVDTQSKPDEAVIPSTKKQFNLANILAAELKEMGAADVTADEHAYVYATIPATCGEGKNIPVVGFIAHMDTSPDASGADIRPQLIRNYDGRDILLNGETGMKLSTEQFPALLNYVGQDLITTDGTTLLGADDKAGVAEIMTMAEFLLAHPEIPHGTVKIGFTPDEEVGCGADRFDVKGFGADVAYTVDGGALGEIEYENFNAASAKIHISGSNIHPGSAKGKMKSAILIAVEFQNMMPEFAKPMYTEGYDGFIHLTNLNGCVESADMGYIIREHDRKKFRDLKDDMVRAADYLNRKYGEGTVEITLKDSYYNMKEKILPHMYLIDIAKDAMRDVGVEPEICPVRGGTDGARLSFMGLPCPNLCTGGHNFHGKHEFVCIQSMEKIAEILVKIVEKMAERGK